MVAPLVCQVRRIDCPGSTAESPRCNREHRVRADRRADAALPAQTCGLAAAAQRRGRHHVRVADQLPDHHASARAHDARELVQRRDLVGNLAKSRDEKCAVESVVFIGEGPCIAGCRANVVDSGGACAAHGVVEHLLLDVEHVQRPRRPQRRGDVQAVVAGAGPHFEQALAGHRREGLPQPRAGDEGMGRLDPEPLPVGTGGRVVAPPQTARQQRSAGGRSRILARFSSGPAPREAVRPLLAPRAGRPLKTGGGRRIQELHRRQTSMAPTAASNRSSTSSTSAGEMMSGGMT